MTSLRTAAFFDVDGTMASSNVFVVFLDFQRSRLQGLRFWAWLAGFALRTPYYLLLDLYDRRLFNTRFSRNYRGIRLDDVKAWQQGAGERFWRRSLFTDAVTRIKAHKAQGHLVVIVSGGLSLMLEPLAGYLEADALYAAHMDTADGLLTGLLTGVIPVHKGKVASLQAAAVELHIALDQSHAYADHSSDRPFLEAAGHPVVVNASRGLRRLAQHRNWPTLRWRTHATVP
ncbi:MAG: HAD-IB family hydrolase [Dehalococcoidia bacterium]|nr:HAD-IB family hydrolase [Dehalococcoidia bacterium]